MGRGKIKIRTDCRPEKKKGKPLIRLINGVEASLRTTLSLEKRCHH